ncbi:MAG TPA: hypothetical protein VFA03_06800 [Acetobacteraceae bacterium]|nr:hypothetical protein [Acetobacteraceae bacterium]
MPLGPSGGALRGADAGQLGGLAQLVLGLVFVMVVAGVAVHGVEAGVWVRLWHNLAARPDGPMRFRFILQPVMATVAAVRDGKADALAGRSPYLWTVLNDRQRRGARLREGLNRTARIILLGLVMDVIYQRLVLHTFFPNEAVIIALVLAFLPYLVVRGLAMRAWRRAAV